MRQQYSNAVGGDAEKIHDPVGTLGVVHVRDNNRVTAKCGNISSPNDLRAKSHNHHGPKTPFKN